MSSPLGNIELGPVGIWASSGLWTAAGEKAADAAAELEDLGYKALWIGSSAGNLEIHGSLLAGTNRLVVASGIINVWADPAPLVAKRFQQLDALYPDRILVGLGSSHAALVTEEEYRKPLTRLRRYLDELDGLDPTVPSRRRVLAALGPKTLAMAAERSAGAHPYLTTPEHTARARQIIGPGALLAPEQMAIFEKDPATARGIARATLALYLQLPNYTNNFLQMGFGEEDLENGGSDLLIDSLIAWGDTEAILDRIAAHHSAGADHVAVQVLTSDDRHTGSLTILQWRELAAGIWT